MLTLKFIPCGFSIIREISKLLRSEGLFSNLSLFPGLFNIVPTGTLLTLSFSEVLAFCLLDWVKVASSLFKGTLVIFLFIDGDNGTTNFSGIDSIGEAEALILEGVEKDNPGFPPDFGGIIAVIDTQ